MNKRWMMFEWVVMICLLSSFGWCEESMVKTIMLPGDVELKLKLIEPGTFMMGSPEDEEGRENTESPVHKITLTKPYFIGVFEVTHGQWKAVHGSVRDNAGFLGSNYDNPMQSTSWKECQNYIKKLNELKLGIFRMPTEAEWEYACRAGTTTRFFWGDDPGIEDIDDYAWYDVNAEGESHEVGSLEPNAWGLYDMTGNVYEWCHDWYAPFTVDAQTDPTGPEEGEFKVFKGGEWFNPAENCRSAFRGKYNTGSWLYFAGVRLVMDCSDEEYQEMKKE